MNLVGVTFCIFKLAQVHYNWLWFNINGISNACGINCGRGNDTNTMILVLVYYIFVVMAFDNDIIMY
jgi:hypothetical protein